MTQAIPFPRPTVRPFFWALGLLLAVPVAARPVPAPVSAADSFRIGSQGVLCTAQLRTEDGHYRTIFDRAYDVVCRDAASPVATLYAFRSSGLSADAVLTQLAGGSAACDPPATTAVAGLPPARSRTCRDGTTGLTRIVYTLSSNGTTYAAAGLVAYNSALQLGLRSLVTDRQVPGEISVAVIGADDPAALAQVQAERLDPAQALNAAYVHANDGSYPDASEFFDRLVARAQLGEPGATRPAEYLANLAAEQSILGNYAEADMLFARADHASTGGDPTFSRLYRNLAAMHRLNEHDAAGAMAILDASLTHNGQEFGFTPTRVAGGYIDQPLAQRLELDNSARRRFWGGELPLSDWERASLLDAQAAYLRGEAARLTGNPSLARANLASAMAQFNAVRAGQVMSMAWLPANVATALAGLAEAEGKPDAAEGLLRQALAITSAQYPDSASLLAARARLAAAMAQHGKTDLALAEYRDLAQRAPGVAGGSEALRPLIGPYFDALVAHPGQTSAADFFIATQALVRPGVARTQAVLARELSAGSDVGSNLFRQSVLLGRDLVTIDQDIARLSDPEQMKLGDGQLLAAALARRQDVASRQTVVLAQMQAFPRYRVVANQTVTLAGLQRALRPDEAYYKLVLVGDESFAILAQAGTARIFRVAAKPAELETIVDAIRDSIALEQGNQLVTNPFDLMSARRLYVLLFGPVNAEVAATRHLIFEPDGALLKLPANLLVTTDDGVAAYQARQNLPNADAFDFTGVAWLGRNHIVTTAVSAGSFLDIRTIPPSQAPHRFLGLGQNAPLTPAAMQALSATRDPCDWPLTLWNHPVNGAELQLAARLIGGNGNEVQTGDAFTDKALKARTDLADFRVVQFATHGLVTAPRPGCAARPALVTSFGPGDSSGLLSFKDIFDLHLNADTVILSACDTAGAASAMATREAGLTTGGNFALDGLVRAFVGAGARGVVASHWPVPDDFNATTRLMTGVFQSGINRSLGDAMQAAQIQLMDDPLTSHPYYWAAFAIVGDATKPLTTQ